MFRRTAIALILIPALAAAAGEKQPLQVVQSSGNTQKSSGAGQDRATLPDIEVVAERNNPADKPYLTSGSSAYLSESDITRFRGTSMGDFLSGIPGVINGDGRNSGAMDVNIRGMQGQGRVPVIVDGASQETTIYHGYNGSVARTYLDPDFIGAAEVEKGVSGGADATGASGGVVRISTISAKDIVLPEHKFGMRIKGGFNTNSRNAPPPGTKGGFQNQGFNSSKPNEVPPASAFYPARGTARPGLLKPTGFNGSIAAAYNGENIELLAAYAWRKNGNYFAGKNGAAPPVGILKDPTYNTPYYGHHNLSAYRAGEEVLNTSQDNASVLLKGKFKYNDQALELAYNRYLSDYGHILGSQINTFGGYQNVLSSINLNSYTAQYRWQPQSPWINFKANAFIAKVDNRINSSYAPSGSGADPNINPKPDKLSPAYFWVGSTRKGITLSNQSRLNQQFSMEYGVAWVHEKVGLPSMPPNGNSIFNLSGKARDGWRREYSLFTNAHWEPLQWLIVDGSLRWQQFSSLDKMIERYEDGKINTVLPIKNSARGWSPQITTTWKPNSHWQVYSKYGQSIRSPSIFEVLKGASFYAFPENNSVSPERARNLELGASYLKEGMWRSNDKLRFHAAIFDNRIKDYITRASVAQKREEKTNQTPPYNEYSFPMGRINLDYARMRGSEVSLDYDTGLWFAGMSWNHYFSTMFCRKNSDILEPDSKRCSAGGIDKSFAMQQIPPKDQITLNLGIRLLNQKLLLGSRFLHISKPTNKGKYVIIGSNGMRPTNWKTYNVVDLYGSYQINKHAEVNFAIDNVGDRYYVDALNAAPLPAPGRTVRLGFSAKF